MFNIIREFISEIRDQFKIGKGRKLNFVDLISQKISFEIFSYLNNEELTRCFRVNKKWHVLASHNFLWKTRHPKIAFGRKQWAKYFGDIGEEPPLPKDIYKILKSYCPFWPDKKVEDTHMLVLIPETIDGKQFDFQTLNEIIKFPKAGHVFQQIDFEEINCNIYPSHWVLMTKDVLEGSRTKSWFDQQILIAEFSKELKINYEVPTALDAVTCIFMHYIQSKECQFNIDLGAREVWINGNARPCLSVYKKLMTFTLCRDNEIIGGFTSHQGLFIFHFSTFPLNYNFVGVAAMRKFYRPIEFKNLIFY